MMTHKIEHPLNEKTHTYLRVEQLLQHLQVSAQCLNDHQYPIFFRSLFDLMDIFEQVQIKSDLAKDLQKQRQAYQQWLGVDAVDQETLKALLVNLEEVYQTLIRSERLGQTLKTDRFLSSIRQRFSLPGGFCCFDLPNLHYWRQQSSAQIEQQVARWLLVLKPLTDALDLCLKLSRETGTFNQYTAYKGFFQSDASEANLLRLTLPLRYGCYPMISGHRHRFAVKFIDFDSNQATQQDISFQLAVCC